MDFCADLKKWTQMLLTDDDAPLVNSVSYGWQGNMTVVHCADEKVASIDKDFSSLAAKGITIIFSSGDSGSGYAPDCTGVKDTALDGEVDRSILVPELQVCCEIAGQIGGKSAGPNPSWQFEEPGGPDVEVGGDSSADRRQLRRGPPGPKMGNCTIFKEGAVTGAFAQPKTSCGGPIASPNPAVSLFPSWPASSQWVTAVGGTRFIGQKEGNAEMATDQFGSGGGFSSFISQSPDATWQSATVAKYFTSVNKTTLPPASSYDPNGRATPDVSALGEGYLVYVAGRLGSVGGTSASTPAFAGMVSLINEALLQKGGKALGFLNPFLYKNEADGFTDITVGTNAIGRGTGPIAYGWSTAPGWDPATGMGTPVFGALLQAAEKAQEFDER